MATQTEADIKQLAQSLLNKEQDKNATYVIAGQKYHFSKSSVFVLGEDNWLRKCMAHIVIHPWFDHFITICILVNSALLASRDYSGNYDPNFESDWNKKIDLLDTIFTFIYLFECVGKIIVMGFSGHKHAYLSDAWNKLDFVIVLISLLNFVPGLNPGFLKALRAARVLRPLKSISKLGAMKLLMRVIVVSMQGLANVFVFLSFVFGIFAILGLHVYNGVQYNYCRETEEIIDDGVSPPYWPVHPEAQWLCNSDESCSGYPNYLGDDTVAKCGHLLKDY